MGIILLNIGGTTFATTEATLRGRGECLFTSLLDGRVPSQRTPDGAYFIDRSPR
jgi:hypothetical protein